MATFQILANPRAERFIRVIKIMKCDIPYSHVMGQILIWLYRSLTECLWSPVPWAVCPHLRLSGPVPDSRLLGALPHPCSLNSANPLRFTPSPPLSQNLCAFQPTPTSHRGSCHFNINPTIHHLHPQVSCLCVLISSEKVARIEPQTCRNSKNVGPVPQGCGVMTRHVTFMARTVCKTLMSLSDRIHFHSDPLTHPTNTYWMSIMFQVPYTRYFLIRRGLLNRTEIRR